MCPIHDKGAIHAYQLASETGALKLIHRTTDVENPFFMAVSRDQKFLYSIHAKSFGGKDPEQVAAYALEGREQIGVGNVDDVTGEAGEGL